MSTCHQIPSSQGAPTKRPHNMGCKAESLLTLHDKFEHLQGVISYATQSYSRRAMIKDLFNILGGDWPAFAAHSWKSLSINAFLYFLLVEFQQILFIPMVYPGFLFFLVPGLWIAST